MYAIIADRYPKNLGKVNGLVTFSVGQGFLVGPALGGCWVLYSAGGFYLPFVVMGSVAPSLGISLVCLMTRNAHRAGERVLGAW